MEQILSYISQYGLPVTIIAACIISFIGLLKICKVFTKINSKQAKKTLYYVLSLGLAFGGTALYFVIFDKTWGNYIPFSIAQASATTALYAIYENLGARKLLQVIALKCIEWFKKNPERKTAKALKSLGLTEDMLIKLQAIAGEPTQKVETPVITSNTVSSTRVYSNRNTK